VKQTLPSPEDPPLTLPVREGVVAKRREGKRIIKIKKTKY